MDKLKKVLSGQDTEDRGGLAEVSAPPAAAGLRGAWGARWLAGGSRAGLQGFLESSSPCTRSPAAIIPSLPSPPRRPIPGRAPPDPRAPSARAPGAGRALAPAAGCLLVPCAPSPRTQRPALERNPRNFCEGRRRPGDVAAGWGGWGPGRPGGGGPGAAPALQPGRRGARRWAGGSALPSRPGEVVGVTLPPGLVHVPSRSAGLRGHGAPETARLFVSLGGFGGSGGPRADALCSRAPREVSLLARVLFAFVFVFLSE